MLEQAPVAMLLLRGEDLIMESANDAMLQIIQKDKSALGKPLGEVLPEMKAQDAWKIMQQVFQTGEPYYISHLPVELEKQGQMEKAHFTVSYVPLKEHGRTTGILEVVVDMTEQISARQRLEEAELNMRGAVELAQLGTWSIDAATSRLTFSDRLIEWFGYDPASNTYDQVIPILEKGDQERVNNAVAHALTPGSGGVYEEVYTVIHPETGRKRIIHAHGKAIFDESGNPVRLNGTAQDVTLQRELQLALEQQVQARTEELAMANEELLAMNEQIEENNKELEKSNELLVHSNEELAQYAYIASHDLQEPLRKIQIFSNLLGSSQLLPEGLQTYVEKISQSSLRMSMLIRDLLEFSRLLKSEAPRGNVDINEVVLAVITDFELLIDETHATVQVGQMPVIPAISLQMNQLFFNLFSNALKFKKHDSPLVIKIDCDHDVEEKVYERPGKPLAQGTYYHIRFTDNGIGFDPEYAEHIFEVFKRLHGRDNYPGSGIGLALCRRIVENHNGILYAESAPGAGSVFHIILPKYQH